MLPPAYESASDAEVEAAFVGQLSMMENNAANIAQGIAGAVGSLGNLFGTMVGGQTGQTIGQISNVASGLGNLGVNMYRQFSGPSPQPAFGAPPQPSFGAPPQPSFGAPPQPSFGAPPQPVSPYSFAGPLTGGLYGFPMAPPPMAPMSRSPGQPPSPPPNPMPGQPILGGVLPPNWSMAAAGLMQNPMFTRALGAAMLPAGATQVPLRPEGAQAEGVAVPDLLNLAAETFRRAAAQAGGAESVSPLSGRMAALYDACETYAAIAHAQHGSSVESEFEDAFLEGESWPDEDASW
jgi:hypothetical protein